MYNYLKKLFDKNIGKITIMILVMTFLIVVVLGGAVGCMLMNGHDANHESHFLGAMLFADYGSVTSSLQDLFSKEALSKEELRGWVIASLIFWCVGVFLLSSITASLSSWFTNRRKRIEQGLIQYSFMRNFCLIIGWDFQVPQLLKKLLVEEVDCDILVLTYQDCSHLNQTVLTTFGDKKARKRIFLQHVDYTQKHAYKKIDFNGVRKIFIIGDETLSTRDITSLRVLEYIKSKCFPKQQIPCYLHLSDFLFYQKQRQEELLDRNENDMLSLTVFNYYASWIWKCFSSLLPMIHQNPSAPLSELMDYRPLRFRKNEGANKTHLYIIGFGHMGQCAAYAATELMNYGENTKNSKITIFDPSDSAHETFEAHLGTLSFPEVEVVFEPISGLSATAQEMMKKSASDLTVSTTIMVTLPNAQLAMKAYYMLSQAIYKENVVINIWQKTTSNNLPQKLDLIDLNLSYSHIALFGMLNELPWYDKTWVEMAECVMKAYDEKEQWANLTCRIRYSNLSCAATFKEKLNYLDYKLFMLSVDAPTSERSLQQPFSFNNSVSKANDKTRRSEHNRWWTEKLLLGGVYNKVRFDHYLWHPSLVPFDDLGENQKEKEDEQEKDDCLLNGLKMAIGQIQERICKYYHGKKSLVTCHQDGCRYYALTCIGTRKLFEESRWGKSLTPDSPLFYYTEQLKKLKKTCLAEGKILVMYNQLAKGADEFFWNAARLAQVPVIAHLPMRIEKYAETFAEGAERENFYWRLRGCLKYTTYSEDLSDDECYANSIRELIPKSDEVWAILPSNQETPQPKKGGKPKKGGTRNTLDFAQKEGYGDKLYLCLPNGKRVPYKRNETSV